MSVSGAAIRRDIFEKIGVSISRCGPTKIPPFSVNWPLKLHLSSRAGVSFPRKDWKRHQHCLVWSAPKPSMLQMQARVFEKLPPKDLRPWQLALVKRKLSGVKFRLAQGVARTVLRQSAQYHPSSLIGWTKAIIAWVLGEPEYRLVLSRRQGVDSK